MIFAKVFVFTTMFAHFVHTSAKIENTTLAHNLKSKRSVHFFAVIRALKHGRNEIMIPSLNLATLHLGKYISGLIHDFEEKDGIIEKPTSTVNSSTENRNLAKRIKPRFAVLVDIIPANISRKARSLSNEEQSVSVSFVPYKNSSDVAKVRKARVIHWTIIGQNAARMAGWGVTMAAAGVATTFADLEIRRAYESQNERRRQLGRKPLDCNLNNFGCVNQMCWVNCGPRIFSSDWCLATSNTTQPMQVAKCATDEDCDSCFKCAMTCVSEEMSSDNPSLFKMSAAIAAASSTPPSI